MHAVKEATEAGPSPLPRNLTPHPRAGSLTRRRASWLAIPRVTQQLPLLADERTFNAEAVCAVQIGLQDAVDSGGVAIRIP